MDFVPADNSNVPVQPEVNPTTGAETAIPSSSDRMAAVLNLMTNGGASTPTGGEPTPEPAQPGEPAAPANPQEPNEPAPAAPPATPEPQVEIPDKFKDENGNIRPEFMKSYLHMESMYGRQAQQMNQLYQTVMDLQQQIAQSQAQPGSPTEPPAAPEAEFDVEAFRETFYEDPVKALSEWDAKREMERQREVDSQQQEYSQKVSYWQNQIRQCEEVYPDFNHLRPLMQEIIRNNQQDIESLPNAIEAVYWVAKGMASSQAPNQPVQPAVDDLLKSENFLKQVSTHPEVQKAILSQYAQGVISDPIPVTIGNQPGASAPATPPMEIRSTKDASRASMNLFKKMFGT